MQREDAHGSIVSCTDTELVIDTEKQKGYVRALVSGN